MADGKCLNCGKLGHSMADCHDTPPAASAQGFEQDIRAAGEEAWCRESIDFLDSLKTDEDVYIAGFAAAWEASEAASRAKLESAEAEVARLRKALESIHSYATNYGTQAWHIAANALVGHKQALAELAKKEGE